MSRMSLPRSLISIIINYLEGNFAGTEVPATKVKPAEVKVSGSVHNKDDG